MTISLELTARELDLIINGLYMVLDDAEESKQHHTTYKTISNLLDKVKAKQTNLVKSPAFEVQGGWDGAS